MLFRRQLLNSSQDFVLSFKYFNFHLIFKYETIETHARAFLTLNILSIGSVCSMPWLCILKNDHIHEGGKVGKTNVTRIKLFSVDSCDLKSMSFKFTNNIFIIFEMPRSSYKSPFSKINISLLFCPFASDVLAWT